MGTPGQDGSHRCSAGTSAARKREAATAFVHHYPKMRWPKRLDELDVRLTREQWRCRQDMPETLGLVCLNTLEYHEVRVPHADAVSDEFASHRAGTNTQEVPGTGHWNHLAIQYRRTKTDRNSLDMPVRCGPDPADFHARKCLDGDLFRSDAHPLVQVSCHTPNAVAAHLGLGTIGVQDPHEPFGGTPTFDQQNAVSANPEMAIAHGAHTIIRQPFRSTIRRLDNNKVVAGSLVLAELHDHPRSWYTAHRAQERV